MSLFRYETHLHTKEASACAILSGVEQVRRFKELGYAGIIVTDHFFNGNSCISSELPWEERVSLLYKGYENAKEEGDRIGLSVFCGWETTFDTTDFLVYGLDKAWLLQHQEILSWTIEEQYQRVQEVGGYVVHAHPFRKRPYIKEIRLFPEYVDAVEVINVGNQNDEFDRQAQAYAKKNKLSMSAGTDSHGIETLHSGVAFRHKLSNIEDFIASMKSGKYELIKPN